MDALHKRIPLRVSLGPYPNSELKEIVETMAEREDLLITPQAARLIASVSSGLPRRARHHLQNLKVFCCDSERRQLGLSDVREFLRASGVDETGLDQMGQRYLAELARRKAASVESLALILGTDPEYVKRWVEGPLVRQGLVPITSDRRSRT